MFNQSEFLDTVNGWCNAVTAQHEAYRTTSHKNDSIITSEVIVLLCNSTVTVQR